MTVIRLKFDVWQYEIVEDGNLYLREKSILTRTEKWFNFQILHNPLEEKFNLPAWFVNACYRWGYELHFVGDKLIVFAGNRISISDQAEGFRIVCTLFFNEQLNFIVSCDLIICYQLMLSDDSVLHGWFWPCHKPDLALTKCIKPFEVNIGPIKVSYAVR